MLMAKPQQVLQIDPPEEIIFHGPFNEVVTSYLKLTNPSERQVCFKVKTTAPKQYCVRPNSGFIPSKGVVNVAVMLQPFDGTSVEERGRHKFMVQSVFASDGDTSMDNIWKNTSSADFMDSKLKVVFDNDTGAEKATSQTPQRSMMAPSAAASSYGSASAAPSGSSATALSGAGEAELRRAVDDNKRLQGQLLTIEQENGRLREKMRELAMGRVAASAPFPTQLVVAVAVLALLLGLIFGKVLF